MRRLILITLCLLLPLKALAAVVVPVAGLPGMAGMSTMIESAAPAETSAHCLQMAADAARDAAGDHNTADPDHPCPHLAMATLAQAAVVFVPADTPNPTPSFVSRERASVVLDVPLPPPWF